MKAVEKGNLSHVRFLKSKKLQKMFKESIYKKFLLTEK
jgi:hypothetical protein